VLLPEPNCPTGIWGLLHTPFSGKASFPLVSKCSSMTRIRAIVSTPAAADAKCETKGLANASFHLISGEFNIPTGLGS
jgi:hypothetical protein